MTVCAADGSKYNLPATKAIRNEFDPKSGLEHSGRGHFPQCLITTVYDVFRRIPVARSISELNSSEREVFKELMPQIPEKCLMLFDRGYPSYDLIATMLQSADKHFVFRCPAKSTFPAVEAFVRSKKSEDIIHILPSQKIIARTPYQKRKKLGAIKLRVVRLVNPKGEISVLLTNLYNQNVYQTQDIRSLYFKRWEIESYYRDEKTILEIEKFHTKTANGIRQELFAIMVMSVISRIMMELSNDQNQAKKCEPQFRHAVDVIAAEAFFLVPHDPQKAVEIFEQILQDIGRIRYYKSKRQRPSAPRVSKKPINRWAMTKTAQSYQA